jgi:non-heme chloroperoxidase
MTATVGFTHVSPVPTATPPDPASGEPEFLDMYLATGIRLRYAARGDGPDTPLILLHGYSDSWFSYSRVLGGLARDRRVYALDLRGHGDSDRPAGGFGMDDLAGDVLAFMDASGMGRAVLAGHSMGSFVAQQAAVRAPERISRLVLIGSATTPRRIQGIDELAAAVDALRDPVPAEFARDFQLSTIHHPVPPEFLDDAVAASLKLPARVWRAVMAGMLATDPVGRLGRLRIPTLILWGERDAVFDRAAQDDLLALLPDAALAVYPDTGHALHWERPGRFVRDLGDFLRD